MANRSSYVWYLILVFYITLALLGQYAPWFRLIYIFIIGAVARILSCSMQTYIIRGEYSKKIESKSVANELQLPSDVVYEMPKDLAKMIWTFIIWTSVFRFSVCVSAPFFVPYMMKDLKLSMLQYVVLASIPYFGRALYFNHWGRAGKHYGPFIGVKLTALYISIVPIIWLLTRSYTVLILTEILAGIFWGGFEINQVLMIQNFMHPLMKEGPRVLLGIHMALTNFFGVIGAVVGSVLIDHQWSYYQVFFFSSVLRFLVVFILIFKIAQLKKSEFSISEYLIYLKKLRPVKIKSS